MSRDRLGSECELSQPRWSRSDLAAMAVIAVLAFGVYANSLPNDFVYDDVPICLQDDRTHDLGRIEAIFTQGYWGASDTSLDGLERQPRPLYRPVTLLSFAINHALTGPSAPAYRVVNLLLHAAISAGVYALCVFVLRGRLVALVAGLLFAVHPVHTEAVVPIVGRSELLAGATAIGALLLHLQDAFRGSARAMSWRYVMTLVLFFVGVFSKESAVTTVGLLVAADVWLKAAGLGWARKLSWKRYLQRRFAYRYIGLFVVVACFLTARRLVLGQLFSSADVIPVSQNVLMDSTLGERLLTSLLLLAKYVYLLFIPHPLHYDYSARAIDVQTRLANAGVLAGLACLLVMVAAVAVSARRRRQVAVAILFFAISYSVVSNVLVRIGTLMAERLVYLPSVGACMLLGLLAGSMAVRWQRPTSLRMPTGDPLTVGALTVGVVVIAVVSAYGALTVRRNQVWRSNQTLYEDGVISQPMSFRCWHNLGILRLQAGDRQAGLDCLVKALGLAPNAYEILARMGWEYTRMGQYERALDLLTRAHEQRWRSETFTLWVRAQLHNRLGQLDETVRLYEEALRINPDHQVALVNLTAIYADSGSGRYFNLDKAYTCALAATRLPAPQPQAYVALADVCVKMNRRDEALRTIARGLKLLEAYRKKAAELCKLDSQGPVYDALETALRDLLEKLAPPPA